MLKYGYSYELLILGLLLFVALCWRFNSTIVRPLYKRLSVAALSLGILLVAMPGKYLYLWFQGGWLLIACVALGHQISHSIPPSRKWLLAIVGACAFMSAAGPSLRWAAIMWTLPSDQSLTVSTQRLQAEIPSGAGVMTTDYWWALADRNRVYDALFSDPDPGAIDYVVLSGNGSGRPGIPVDMNRKYESGLMVTDDQLSRNPAHLGPLRLSRSAYGFGAYLLARRH